jgi:hypothetical protein
MAEGDGKFGNLLILEMNGGPIRATLLRLSLFSS